MKKILLAVTLTLLLTTGCNFKKEDVKKEEPKFESKGEVLGTSYEVLSNCNIYSFHKAKRGYYIDTLNQPNAPYWYYILMGEKNTGGYAINIVDVKEEDNKVIVIVKETKPKEEDIVTQAFTYPSCCIKFSNSVNIEIRNTEGEKFDYIG